MKRFLRLIVLVLPLMVCSQLRAELKKIGYNTYFAGQMVKKTPNGDGTLYFGLKDDYTFLLISGKVVQNNFFNVVCWKYKNENNRLRADSGTFQFVKGKKVALTFNGVRIRTDYGVGKIETLKLTFDNQALTSNKPAFDTTVVVPITVNKCLDTSNVEQVVKAFELIENHFVTVILKQKFRIYCSTASDGGVEAIEKPQLDKVICYKGVVFDGKKFVWPNGDYLTTELKSYSESYSELRKTLKDGSVITAQVLISTFEVRVLSLSLVAVDGTKYDYGTNYGFFAPVSTWFSDDLTSSDFEKRDCKVTFLDGRTDFYTWEGELESVVKKRQQELKRREQELQKRREQEEKEEAKRKLAERKQKEQQKQLYKSKNICPRCKGTRYCFDCNGSGNCGNCNGRGWLPGVASRTTCGACMGAGVCGWCNGSGICIRCHGSGRYQN